MPFLDEKGLGHFWNHIVTRLNGKANKEDLTSLEDKFQNQLNNLTFSINNQGILQITIEEEGDK